MPNSWPSRTDFSLRDLRASNNFVSYLSTKTSHIINNHESHKTIEQYKGGFHPFQFMGKAKGFPNKNPNQMIFVKEKRKKRKGEDSFP